MEGLQQERRTLAARASDDVPQPRLQVTTAVFGQTDLNEAADGGVEVGAKGGGEAGDSRRGGEVSACRYQHQR